MTGEQRNLDAATAYSVDVGRGAMEATPAAQSTKAMTQSEVG
jgi:hypothetical protein